MIQVGVFDGETHVRAANKRIEAEGSSPTGNAFSHDTILLDKSPLNGEMFAVDAMQARKMNAEMSDLIEKTKVQEQVNERRKKRTIDDVNGGNDGGSSSAGADTEERLQKKLKRKFKQNRMIGAEYDDKDNKVNKRLLTSIFTRAAESNDS